MNPLDLLKGAAVGLLLGLLSGWWVTAEYKNAKFEAYKAELTVATANRVAKLTKEQGEREERDRLDRAKKDGAYEQTVKDLERKLVDAKRSANDWRVRVSIPASSCGPAEGQAGGSKPGLENVSVEAGVSDALRSSIQDLAGEADRLRLWGERCHAEVNLPRCVCQ